MRYLQSILFDLKKQTKKRRYDHFIEPIIYDIYIENEFKSEKPNISLEK